MTAPAGDDRAAALVLRLDDFPATWREVPDAQAGTAPGDEAGLGSLLASRFPEEHVRAVADSPAFFGPGALLACSTAVVLAHESAGREAFDAVATAAFASSFAEAVGAAVAPPAGGATFLGSATSPLALPPGPGEGTAHRIAFAGATADALVAAYVDLVALGARDRVVLLWLASAPGQFPTAERHHLVARARCRVTAG